MKIITMLFFVITLVSCKCNDANIEDTKKNNAHPKDSTIVGADQDENGCLASAGYTWSKLNKECVRAFTGIQLNPVKDTTTEDETLCAYILFNEKGDKAEVFLPEEKSFILTRNSEGQPWIFDTYKLIRKNGYVLIQDGESIYTGDGQIGNKVTGSDNPDGQE